MELQIVSFFKRWIMNAWKNDREFYSLLQLQKTKAMFRFEKSATVFRLTLMTSYTIIYASNTLSH